MINAADDETLILPQLLQAAILLGVRHFPTVSPDGSTSATTTSSVLYILDGHVEVWSGWSRLDVEDARRFASVLHHRSNQLANPEYARSRLRRLLDAKRIVGCHRVAPHSASEGCPTQKDNSGTDYTEAPDDEASDDVILVDPGMDNLNDAVDLALRRLDDIRRQRSGHTATATAGLWRALASLGSASGADPAARTVVTQQYRLLPHHMREPAGAPGLIEAPPLDECFVPFDSLEEITDVLDAAFKTTYRTTSVRRFRNQVRRGEHGDLRGLDLVSGRLNSLLAYTGFGKSVVLIEAFVCWAVTKGITSAFIVPTNAEVVEVTWRIKRALQAWRGHLIAEGSGCLPPGLAEPLVVPLTSPRSQIDVAVKATARGGADDPVAVLAWESLGYGCPLAATAVDEDGVDKWIPGAEPCAKLRRRFRDRDGREREEIRSCPWRDSCGKFRQLRSAAQADVIVTSHINLMVGRARTPIEDRGTVTERLTVEELILRRCQVVVADEIDAFQRSALERAGRGLVLARGGAVDTPLHALDADFGNAFGNLHPEVDENVRESLTILRYHAESYVSHLNYERLGGARPARSRQRGLPRYWQVPRRWDNWLAARMFGVEDERATSEQVGMFRSLFRGEGRKQLGEPAAFPGIRELLYALVTVGPGSRRVGDVRDALDDLLQPPELETEKEEGEDATVAVHIPISDDERPKVINRLLRRALLEQIRLHLHALTASSGQLVDAGVASAEEIADALNGYTRWQAAPTGPLNRLMFAFREHNDLAGQTPVQLTAAAFGGDPHSYLVSLGDVTALAAAGTRRIILGLSATSYYPLAPHHHVHVEPRWWVKDNQTSQVRVEDASIRLADGRREKISGRVGPERESATIKIASELWRTRLQAEVQRLWGVTAGQNRILLATTSYHSIWQIAEGLVRAGADPSLICLAVPPGTADRYGAAGGWKLLPADRLADFSATDCRILIAPLARVERGVNIIGTDDKSALASIWLIVRPIPLIDEPPELVAHIQALAHFRHAESSSSPLDVLKNRRESAGRTLDDIVKVPPYFHSQPDDVQLGVVAEILVSATQLIGRARRGGTPAVLYLVDGAFMDESMGTDFAGLIKRLQREWARCGVLRRMMRYHESTLRAFFDFADRTYETEEQPC